MDAAVRFLLCAKAVTEDTNIAVRNAGRPVIGKHIPLLKKNIEIQRKGNCSTMKLKKDVTGEKRGKKNSFCQNPQENLYVFYHENKGDFFRLQSGKENGQMC